MIKIYTLFFCLWLLPTLSQNEHPNSQIQLPSIIFTQNRGQVTDQHYKPRKDIQYIARTEDIVYHFRNNGISYQLHRIDSWEDRKLVAPQKSNLVSKQKETKVPKASTFYRVDINWLNSNTNACIKPDTQLLAYDNYYLPAYPTGLLNVKSYTGITYQNIYNNIHLHYYQEAGNLKYDYLLAPYSDYSKITLEVKGAIKIAKLENGDIEITTPLGSIIENAPKVYQGKKTLRSSWIINGNILKFKIEGRDISKPAIIDPLVRSWGTYFGTPGDIGYDCSADVSGNVFHTGLTIAQSSSLIATQGAFQTVNGGNGFSAYLVKFDPNGQRLWSTFYSGIGGSSAFSCATDPGGNIYLGAMSGDNGLATIGSYQNTPGGGADAMLVKFDTNGARLWSTYYGAEGDEEVYDVTTDALGNVCLTGQTNSTLTGVMSTPNAFQTVYGGALCDAFIVKFNPLGSRLWATYYGGALTEGFYSSCTDIAGNIYIAGYASSTNIATPGTFQSSINSGGFDAILVKFNSTGVRQWATYYGGPYGWDFGHFCGIDILGNVYLAGNLTTTLTASQGSYQSTFGGGYSDAFIAKFDTTGNRLWGTYYGGSGNEYIYAGSIDSQGNIIVAGSTSSTLSPSISTVNGWQTFLGGGITDAFLTKFDASGQRLWGSYYGGAGSETAWGLCVSTNTVIHMSGKTTSSTSITSPGTWQSTYSTSPVYNSLGFVAKFLDCPPLTMSTTANQSICAGQSRTLSASGVGISSYSWNTGATTSSIVVVPNTTTDYTLTLFTPTIGCYYTSVMTVSVFSVNVANTSICAGSIASLQAWGANSYTWSTGSNSPTLQLTPSITTSYSVTGSDGTCTDTRTVNVIVFPTPMIAISAQTVCAGQLLTVVASGANTYTWNSGATGPQYITILYNTDTLMVTGTNSYNCTNTATTQVVARPYPNITANSGTLCVGSTYTITPAGAQMYTITGNSYVVTPTLSTAYYITGTDTTGCQPPFPTPVYIMVYNLPIVSASGGSLCSGNSFSITPSGAQTYTITGGTFNVSPLTTSIYSITGANTVGCFSSNTATVQIDVYPAAQLTTTPQNTTICQGETVQLTANGTNTYLWSNGQTNSTISVSPTITSIYSITGANADGCFSSKTIVLNVNECTGIKGIDPQDKIIKLYPNPVLQTLSVFVPQNYDYTVTDNLNKTIQQGKLAPGISNLFFSGISNGVYYIRISGNNLSEVYKIIKIE